MSKRALIQKFHVGQRCLFAFPESSTWAVLNGTECVIVAPKFRKSGFWTQDFDGSNQTYHRGTDERYEVEYGDDEGVSTQESNLRPLYDGDELSTWESFTKATGLRLDRSSESA